MTHLYAGGGRSFKGWQNGLAVVAGLALASSSSLAHDRAKWAEREVRSLTGAHAEKAARH